MFMRTFHLKVFLKKGVVPASLFIVGCDTGLVACFSNYIRIMTTSICSSCDRKMYSTKNNSDAGILILKIL